MNLKFAGKLGLSFATIMVSMTGCAIWQEEGPPRYAAPIGAKRIPALNPGGRFSSNPTNNSGFNAPVQAGQGSFNQPAQGGQQYNNFASSPNVPPANSFSSPGHVPQQYSAPPAPPVPPQTAQYYQQPNTSSPHNFQSPPAAASRDGYVDSAALKEITAASNRINSAGANNFNPAQSVPPRPAVDNFSSPPSAVKSPFAKASDGEYPVLSDVPAPRAKVDSRINHANNSVNELQRELDFASSRRNSAYDQALSENIVAENQYNPANANNNDAFGFSSGSSPESSSHMSLDDIDRRFGSNSINSNNKLPPPPSAGVAPKAQVTADSTIPRSNLPAPDIRSDNIIARKKLDIPTGMTPIDSSYSYNQPAYKVPDRNIDFKSTKIDDSFSTNDPGETTIKIDTPEISGRYKSAHSKEFDSPAPADTAYVTKAPDVFSLSAKTRWKAEKSSSAPITLNPPDGFYESAEEGFLPESRYAKRRRYERRRPVR